MEKFYVEVKDGQVIGNPKLVSSNPSDSPNTEWNDEQMKLNGFCYVDLSYDSEVEKMDFEHPIVSEFAVVYPTIKLTDDELLDRLNSKLELQRKFLYPPLEDMVHALWDKIMNDDSSPADAIKVIRQTIDSQYKKLTKVPTVEMKLEPNH